MSNEPIIPGPRYTEGPVTIREVYALLGQTRAEILGELREHEGEHRREADAMVSRGRYAVTTAVTIMLSLAGNILVLIFALRGGT